MRCSHDHLRHAWHTPVLIGNNFGTNAHAQSENGVGHRCTRRETIILGHKRTANQSLVGSYFDRVLHLFNFSREGMQLSYFSLISITN